MLTVRAAREGPPWPIDLIVTMTCDGDHGLLRVEPQHFPDIFGISAAGWKETYTLDGRKRWLGPCCSGKRPC